MARPPHRRARPAGRRLLRRVPGRRHRTPTTRPRPRPPPGLPRVTIARDSRDLPTTRPSTRPRVARRRPAELHTHLDAALGHRTPTVVATVLAALRCGGPGDATFQQTLQSGPDYALPDEAADTVFAGPVTVITGRQDRVVGYADQFRALRRYPAAPTP
ncbi:hypothetical protein NKG94_09275 [Micromonospora sp. M12]